MTQALQTTRPYRNEQYLDRPLPSNEDAERAVLGAIILEPRFMAVVADEVIETDFYNPIHRMVYSAMLSLFESNRTIDPIWIGDELKRQKTPNGKVDALAMIGGVSVISNLAYGLPHFDLHSGSEQVRDYAVKVKKTAQVRKLIRTLNTLTEDALGEEYGPDAMLDRAQTIINHVCTTDTKRQFSSIGELSVELAQHIRDVRDGHKSANGLYTGFHRFDTITNGLQKANLIVIGGRPGQGKSSFAGHVAVNVAENSPGAVVAIFSLEMSKQEYTQRLVASEAQVELNKIRSGTMTHEMLERVDAAAVKLAGLNIEIDDASSRSATSMRSQLLRLRHERKRIDLVVIDFIQRMTTTRRTDSRQQEVSRIAQELKSLAKDFDVPVMALSSLNRAAETRADGRPKMADLRESGDIESEADLVGFIYRPSRYNESEDESAAELIVDKNRHGATETVPLKFIGPFTRFTNPDRW